MGLELGKIKIKRFADGEIYVQLQESVRGCDVFLVQPTCPPANENLMELLVMIDACRRASAKNITAVIPYFGYARADRKVRVRQWSSERAWGVEVTRVFPHCMRGNFLETVMMCSSSSADNVAEGRSTQRVCATLLPLLRSRLVTWRGAGVGWGGAVDPRAGIHCCQAGGESDHGGRSEPGAGV